LAILTAFSNSLAPDLLEANRSSDGPNPLEIFPSLAARFSPAGTRLPCLFGNRHGHVPFSRWSFARIYPPYNLAVRMQEDQTPQLAYSGRAKRFAKKADSRGQAVEPASNALLDRQPWPKAASTDAAITTAQRGFTATAA
jgi:hypothetical protein